MMWIGLRAQQITGDMYSRLTVIVGTIIMSFLGTPVVGAHLHWEQLVAHGPVGYEKQVVGHIQCHVQSYQPIVSISICTLLRHI